jgi:hypothetical protein
MYRVHPDISRRIQGYANNVMGMFGQDVVLRKFISASAGSPDMGIADQNCYQSRPAQMEMRQLTLEEMQTVGGQDIWGTYEVFSTIPIQKRDEIVYLGETYRFITETEQDSIGTVIYYRGIAQRGTVTGYFE